MKTSLMVLGVLFSAATLVSLPSVAAAGENDRAAMALCDCNNPANQEICSRLREANALERGDPNQGPQSHSMQRAPAGFDPAKFQAPRNTR
jgi:hypothetical protein